MACGARDANMFKTVGVFVGIALMAVLVTKKALKGLSDKERQAVETVTKGIINKLLHSPMSYLRSDSKGDKATVAQIEEIFGLQD